MSKFEAKVDTRVDDLETKNKIEDFSTKLKITKWWHHIPLIGVIAYTLKIEFWLNEAPKEFRKVTRQYKKIVNIVSLLISLSFLITFFVLRNKDGYGPWPWFFWLGLGISLSINISPLIAWSLYYLGWKKYLKIAANNHVKTT